MKSLVEILEKYPTDKLNSGYGEFYEELFRPIRHSVESVLEIGIAQGGSLRAWRDYFPEACIYGIDKELEFVRPFYGDPTIVTYCEDATKLASWAVGRYFEIIIDDGSHIANEVIATFVALWPTVISKGYYIIEDVSSTRPRYGQVCDWFAGYAKSVIIFEGYIASLTFRPNMIVLQKR